MAWAVLAGGGLSILWRSRSLQARAARVIVVAISVVVFSVLALLTRQQTRIWANSHTLWAHVIKIAPRTGVAHANLARLWNADGEYELARRHASSALEILPGNRTAHVALGRAELELGNLEAAEKHLLIALEIKPDSAQLWARLAITHTKQGRAREAEACWQEAIALDPDGAHWRFLFAGLVAGQGRYEEALNGFAETIRIDPDYVEAYYRSGVLKAELGDFAGAIALWEEGLRRTPMDSALLAKLAWVLATSPVDTLRNGQRAVTLATRAIAISPGRNLRAREALAAALARVGKFDRAVATASDLLTQQEHRLDEPMRHRLEDALTGYRAQQPFQDER